MWFKHIFKTKKAITEAIREVINNAQINEPLSGDNLEFMLYVLSHHSEWEEKQGSGVESIVVRYNFTFGKNRELILKRTDGSEIDISWSHCLSPRTKKNDVLASARYEIIEQKKAINKSGTCYLCGDELSGAIHIDHVNYFDILIHDFLSAESKTYDDIEIEVVDGYTEQFKDRALADRWKAYHLTNAVMKPVHAKCNLSRGKA